MKKTLLIFLLGCLAVAGIQAQKFGYVNTALLLQDMPEVQAADAELEALQSQLLASGQQKVQQFEADYAEYMRQANNGELSKVQMAQAEEKLTKDQQAIGALEQEMQDKVLAKREELLGPILEKVDVVIKEIGSEGGYTFIFDASVQGAMLYAPDGDDLINLVRQKLAAK